VGVCIGLYAVCVIECCFFGSVNVTLVRYPFVTALLFVPTLPFGQCAQLRFAELQSFLVRDLGYAFMV